MAMKGELRCCQHDCDGSSEIVRRVRRELAEAGDRCLKSGEQLVPGDSEILNLVLCGWYGKTFGQVADTDAQGRSCHAVHRLHGMAAEKVATHRAEDQKTRHKQEERVAILAQNVCLFLEGS